MKINALPDLNFYVNYFESSKRNSTHKLKYQVTVSGQESHIQIKVKGKGKHLKAKHMSSKICKTWKDELKSRNFESKQIKKFKKTLSLKLFLR